MLDAIVDRGAPIVANRTLAIFRRLCNWSIERGIITVSPCDKIKAPAAEESRDRVLSDGEVRLAWGVFGGMGWPFGPIAKLLLLIGARRDEVASARWSEIDLAAKMWTIAKERSKNGAAHEIPLSDAAVAILAALPRIGDRCDALVFSTMGRTAVSRFSRAKDQIDAAMRDALKAVKGEAPAL
jgi:integrase